MKPGHIEIITPEGVKLQFETAGIGSRAIAMLIDAVIMLTVFGLMVLALFLSIGYSEDILPNLMNIYVALVIIVAVFITLGYFMLFELLLKGRTPGKKLVKIRVVKINGSPATAGSIIMRNLLRVIDQLPTFYLLGIIVAFVNLQERRIGDLVAGTMVVKEFSNKPDKMQAQSLNSLTPDILLDPREIQILQSFFMREKELAKARREQLQAEYIYYFKAKYNIYPGEGEKTADFLKSLLMRKDESAMAPELTPR